MRILLSGSTGLVGSELFQHLTSQGHTVIRLVRKGQDGILWDPAAGTIDAKALEAFDAVIHLAGENIANSRWTEQTKRRIYESRVGGTGLLAEALSRLERPPEVFLSASAIGYYGHRGAELLREDSPAGKGFLPETCQAWEAAAQPAARKGIRLVNLRFGVILSKKGGALAKMLLPFRMGLGGKIGAGDQYFSWISLTDIPGVVKHILTNISIKGPVNVVSPNAVTNAAFTEALGRALSRPTVLPMPAFAARLAFGEMADEMLLASTRVEPRVLSQTQYRFTHPQLDTALQELLR